MKKKNDLKVSFYGSKPFLTIASKFLENPWKTIDVNGQSEEKYSMVIVWWQQNHWKTLKTVVPRKKITILSSGKIIIVAV